MFERIGVWWKCFTIEETGRFGVLVAHRMCIRRHQVHHQQQADASADSYHTHTCHTCHTLPYITLTLPNMCISRFLPYPTMCISRFISACISRCISVSTSWAQHQEDGGAIRMLNHPQILKKKIRASPIWCRYQPVGQELPKSHHKKDKNLGCAPNTSTFALLRDVWKHKNDLKVTFGLLHIPPLNTPRWCESKYLLLATFRCM